MNNNISAFSSLGTGNYVRPQVSLGQQSPGGPTDSVGTVEPGGLMKRPQFAAPVEATEGQRRSVSAARSLVYAVAMALVCAGAGGCATVHRPQGEPQVASQPAPAAQQAGRAVRDFHEHVNKPVANAAKKGVQDWHENVNKPIGHWFRDRFKEFKDGVQGK